jgi:hypothetical protein
MPMLRRAQTPGAERHESTGSQNVRTRRADRGHPLLSRRTQRGDVRPAVHQLLGHLLRRPGRPPWRTVAASPNKSSYQTPAWPGCVCHTPYRRSRCRVASAASAPGPYSSSASFERVTRMRLACRCLVLSLHLRHLGVVQDQRDSALVQAMGVGRGS